MTNTGRFVSREEASEIAQNADQIESTEENENTSKRLDSYDINLG